MNTTIHKYPLVLTSDKTHPQICIIMLPKGAQILSIQTQHNRPVLWAEVNPEEPLEDRRVLVMGTGHALPSQRGRFISTFQLGNGVLVFHVYEAYEDNEERDG